MAQKQQAEKRLEVMAAKESLRAYRGRVPHLARRRGDRHTSALIHNPGWLHVSALAEGAMGYLENTR